MDIVEKIQTIAPKILVVGDIMLDHFIFGNVERISPEAPVPVVRSIKEKYSLGGCGNVLRNLINLGVQSSVISCVGTDQAGKKIINELTNKDLSTKNILQSELIQTTEKMRIVAEGQQLVRVDWDANSLEKKDYDIILNLLHKKITCLDAIIISDYNKGLCKEFVLSDIISKAKEFQIPIFVDPKGKKWNKYQGAFIITPNLKEVEDVIGRPLINDKDIETAGMEICNNLNLEACLITRGSQGMSYISKDIKLHIASEAKEIYDVSGAGDTVIASLTAGMLVGFDPETVIRFANKAAGIVVGHIGTTAITIPELLENGT